MTELLQFKRVNTNENSSSVALIFLTKTHENDRISNVC